MEKFLRNLRELLIKENSLLKEMVKEKFISADALNELKEIQQRKKPLLKELFCMGNLELQKSWKDLKELSLLNTENKELLIKLIEIYRYY